MMEQWGWEKPRDIAVLADGDYSVGQAEYRYCEQNAHEGRA